MKFPIEGHRIHQLGSVGYLARFNPIQGGSAAPLGDGFYAHSI